MGKKGARALNGMLYDMGTHAAESDVSGNEQSLSPLSASSSHWHLMEGEALALCSSFPSVFTCQAIRRTAVIQSTRKRNRNKDRRERNIYNVSFFGTARAGLYA